MTEDELHAYVDGELPADRVEAVLTWLAAHPEQAALVAGWRAQAESIRARYADVAGEPVPDRLKVETLMRTGRAIGRRWTAVAVAASLAAFLIGGGAGWIARGASAPSRSGFDVLTADALQAYKLYVVEVRHPVEVPGRRTAAHDAMAIEAARRIDQHSRSVSDGAQTRRRPPAARTDRRSGCFLYV